MKEKIKYLATKIIAFAFSVIIILGSISSIERKEMPIVHGLMLIVAVILICYLIFINVDMESKNDINDLKRAEEEERKIFGRDQEKEIRVQPLEESEETNTIIENFNLYAKLRGEEITIYYVPKNMQKKYKEAGEYEKIGLGKLRNFYKIL